MIDDLKGKAVLVHTGWDAYWRTDTYSNGQHPFVTKEAADSLAKAGVALKERLHAGVGPRR